MIKKKSIFVVIFIFLFFGSCEAQDEQFNQKLFIGDCSLSIPYAFNMTVTEHEFIVFDKSSLIKRQIGGESGSFELYWKDKNSTVTNEIVKSKEKIGNLIVYKLEYKDFIMYRIEGDTFYVETNIYDDKVKNLTRGCNETWGEEPYYKNNTDSFKKDIEKKFVLIENESKMFINYVFPETYKEIKKRSDKDIFFMKKSRLYLQKYCRTEICKMMISEYTRKLHINQEF